MSQNRPASGVMVHPRSHEGSRMLDLNNLASEALIAFGAVVGSGLAAVFTLAVIAAVH